ncbi:MAG: hypothetical protein HC822_03015 [Oscillochloris sp.]|nr:hypothetical protein [Oscillochloris sp.]
MNINQDQARKAGIALVVFGIVALFDLWWMLPLALLIGGGYVIYQRQQAAGKPNEAVQALLWGVGLAVLMVLDLLWPGVLLLGGASLLLRGREVETEQRARRMLAQLPLPRRNSNRQKVTIVNEDQPTTGATTRLS